MTTSSFIFSIYLFLAIFCAGGMSVLQLQHYSLYSKVGKENFKEYIQANNKAAFIPSILPALLLLITTILLLFTRPEYMSFYLAVVSFCLNLLNIISTMLFQGRIHVQLLKVGFNEDLIKLLIKTNWIRTIVFLAQALIAVYCVFCNRLEILPTLN